MWSNLLTTYDGKVLVEYTYDAWGNVLPMTGTHTYNVGQWNPLCYRGYVYDQETKLYYLQSRYYDADIGRFINSDSILGANLDMIAFNLYSYCGNNPICYIDPTGAAKQPWELMGFVYDGSMRDFKRLNAGLPPYAYEKYLNDTTCKPQKVGHKENRGKGVTRTLNSMTYIPADKTIEVHRDMLRENYGYSATDLMISGGATVISIGEKYIKGTGSALRKAIPYASGCIVAVEIIDGFNKFAEYSEIKAYEQAMSNGTGVLIINWSISGTRVVGGTYNTFYPWNGSDPFEW